MWDVEDIKEACDRIERNTIYGAFECCQQFFSSIMGNEDILKLRELFEDRRLTWNALYKAWDSAFSDRIPSADESTLTKILSDRAAKEARALEYFDGSNCLPLYHELENRSFREILPYIRTHYRLNLERFEKYECSPKFLEVVSSLCEARMKKLEKKRSVIPSQTDILHQVFQEDIFSRIDSWDALMEYVTLLAPKDTSASSARRIQDTDNLYDALMALQILRYKGRKKYPISQITTCSLCWRVADPSTAKKKDKAHCHVHHYEKTAEKPARKKAYARALAVTRKLRYAHSSRSRLLAALTKFFPYDEKLIQIRLDLWNWWEYEPPQSICPTCGDQIFTDGFWEALPHVAKFLRQQGCPLESHKAIIEAMMPLDSSADVQTAAAYDRWITAWTNDIRYFLPVMAHAETWLAIYEELNPSLPVDI